MSFRTEVKLNISKSNLNNFLNWLNDNKFREIYKKRKVSSVYFDNLKFQTYWDSVEGLTPRKKIRLRYYDDDKKNLFIEKKISSVSGRFKTSNQSKNLEQELNGIFDKDYGICFPVVLVNYFRRYFLNDNVRITLDTDINFVDRRNGLKKNLEEIVAEIKYNSEKKFKIIESFNDFKAIRFSKYCKGIELLKIN